MSKPIFGHVPNAILPPALPDAVRVEPEPAPRNAKSPNWRKGLPRNTKKSDVFGPDGQPRAIPKPPPVPSAPLVCQGCSKAVAPLQLDMIAELVRIARDRMAETESDGRTDVLFLAARVDGYCSLSCWRMHAEQPKR